MSRRPKIQLYKKESTKEQILRKYGDFILDDICTYCVTEENFETSEYGLDAEFITDDEGLFKCIEEEAYLKVKMDYGDEIFSIVDIQKTPNAITIYARQITWVETMHMWLEDVRPELKNGLEALIHMQDGAIGNHDLEFESDITDISTAYYLNKSLYEAIHSADNSFLVRWGGDIQRRGYKLIINKRIGVETGFQIESNKNLTGFEATTNIDNVITRIKPVGFNGITIDGFVDSVNLDKYKYIRTVEYKYENIKLRSDLEENYNPEAEENQDDIVFDELSEAQAKLIELAQAEYEKEIDILSATYNINFVDLSRTEEYKNYTSLEVVNLGDYIHVYEKRYNLDIVVRAIKKRFDVLKGMTEEITVNNGAKEKEVPSLSALSGKVDSVVENVVATNMDVEILKVNKANISDLKATNADIEVLNAEVATIGTLVNGNLTSNNIQSMIITGDKFTVENGFIKNAMVDSLSADKINTGTLNTNNVNIQSEDGSMIMNGSTQQFKDKNGTVRIQIGKDANGEFTFCLFSQDGIGVLIDDTGIQSGAIGEGLIVNDMINENASISGTKLDINSVIKTINDNGTETIKSNRIYLDEQNQSLQIAFNQLKTKVDTIENVAIEGDLAEVIEQVTSNTTNLEIAQGQINSLISNTTITKSNGSVVQLKDEFNSTANTVNSHSQTISSMTTNIDKLSGEIDNVEIKTSSIEQNLEGFKTTVSSTYATQSELNETNENVSNAQDVADNALNKANTNANDINGLASRVSTAEQKITADAIISTVSSSETWKTQTNNINSVNNTANTALNNSKTNASNISGLTTRISTAEQKITSDAIISTVTSSTSWSDIESGISNAQTTADTGVTNASNAQSTANTANTTANTALNKANTNASNISGLTTRISTAEQKITSDAIISTVTSSTSWKNQADNISTIQTTANTAKTTADTGVANANKAQSTADNAQSTADTALSKANTNATNISGLVTRVNTAEQKITSDAIISTVTNSTSWENQTTSINNAQSTANTANTNASKAQSSANTAQSSADKAQSTADKAVTDASKAQSTASTAQTTADTANTNAINALNKANTNASNITSLTTRINTAEQKITADSIISTVTSSTSWTTQTNNISNAQSTANKAQSTANTANTNANNAQSTADTAVSNASKAQSTANTAVSNASKAQSTADTAVSNASKAQSTADSAKVDASNAQDTADNAQDTADSALNKANTNANNITSLTTRMNTAEQKITADSIISTVTSSTIWNTQTTSISNAQNTANTANTNASKAQSTADKAVTDASKAQSSASTANTTANTALNKANTNATTITTVQSSVTQLSDKISWMVKSGTSQSSMTLTDKMYSLISDNITLTASHINLHGYVTANNNFKINTNGSITAKNGSFTGTITGSKIIGSGDGNRILINNGDYEVQTGNTTKGFLGLRTLDDNFDVARLALSSTGLNKASDNYFVIVPYNKTNNPSNYNYPYVDIAYRCQAFKDNNGEGDVSNIKMFGDGDIRLAPIRRIIFTTNYSNGSYGGANERDMGIMSSSSSEYYNNYFDFNGCIRNTQSNTGLILGAQRTDGSTACLVRAIVYSDGNRVFGPVRATEDNVPHFLGSANYRWQTLYSVSSVNTSSDRTLKENIKYLSSTPNTRTIKDDGLSIQDMYDFIKDDLFLASYNWKHDTEKEEKLGFIAQDIIDTKVGDKILVCNRDKDSTLGYDTGNFVSVISGALKVNITKTEAMQEEINMLRNEITELKGIINELRK